ncbi:hypothetical protein GJAV_G00104900, partial [Gymnothorax javanicus]
RKGHAVTSTSSWTFRSSELRSFASCCAANNSPTTARWHQVSEGPVVKSCETQVEWTNQCPRKIYEVHGRRRRGSAVGVHVATEALLRDGVGSMQHHKSSLTPLPEQN